MSTPSQNDKFADLMDRYEMDPLECWETEDLVELQCLIDSELQSRYHDGLAALNVRGDIEDEFGNPKELDFHDEF